MSEPDKVQQEPFTEGFSDFFSTQRQTDNPLTESLDTIEVSVIEASRLLAITERSVWRRIASKKLVSRNHHGKTYVTLRQSDVSDKSADMSEVVSVEQTDVSVPFDDRQPDILLADIFKEMQAKLESAVYRNGYLESQLQNHQEQQKLLPDFQAQAEKARVLEQRLEEEAMQKQALLLQLQQESEINTTREQNLLMLQAELEKYKTAWWHRFGAWFIGQKS